MASAAIPRRARVPARSPPRTRSTSTPSGITGSSQASDAGHADADAAPRRSERAAAANDFSTTSRPALLEQKIASPGPGGCSTPRA